MEKKEYNYKTLSFKEMVEYIEKNAPQDKKWFKSIAYDVVKDKDGNIVLDKNGKDKLKYSHLRAKREFCKKYMPEIIPVAKEKKPNVSDILKDW